jgi:hypothetical protein
MKHHGPASPPPPTLKSAVGSEEGWQVFRPRQCCMRYRVPSEAPKPHSPLYLAAVAGKCLNCLSFSHRRADYHLPTRCFNCHGLRHHLRDCKRPRKSHALHFVGDPEACSNVDGWCFIKDMHDGLGARPAMQAMHSTLTSHGVGDTSGALTSALSAASGFPKPDLTFPIALVSLFQHS